MIEHIAPISGIATSNKYIATAGYDNRVILWDSVMNKSVGCGFHDHLVNQATFSPCGQFLLTSSSDYSARLWSVPEMKLLTIMNEHEDDVEGVSFHPSKSIVATVSRDKQLRVFDFKGNLLNIFTGHKKDVLSVVWKNSNELLTVSDDGSIRSWSLSENKELELIDLGGIETDTIIISQQGVIFAGNDEGQIISIDKNNNKAIIEAHDAGIKKLCYDYNFNKLISLSYDGVFKVWEVVDTKLNIITKASYPSNVWARSCAFLGEDKIVFVSFTSKYITFKLSSQEWDSNMCNDTKGINAFLLSGENIYYVGDSGILFKNNKKYARVPSLCNFLIQIDNTILSGGQTGELFNILSGEVLYKHNSPLNCAKEYLYNSQKFIIIGTYTGEVLVFKVVNEKVNFFKKISFHDNAIKDMDIGDNLIYTVCADSNVTFHCLDKFSLIKKVNNVHEKIINGCSYYKDGFFASVGRDLILKLTSVDRQKEIVTPHKNSIKCIAISGDKKFIATGDYRGNVYILDLDNNIWHRNKITYAGISSLLYDSNKGCFVASSYDGAIYPIK